MSDQHPNPKNKVPGKNCGSRNIHNQRNTKGSQRSRAVTERERGQNAACVPPNRAGLVAHRAAARKKVAEAE